MVLRFFLFALLFLLISCTDLERSNPDDERSINYVAVQAGYITYGGETYKTVVIGTQTWFQRNLNYDVPDNDTDVCYDYDPANCAIYGRLYDWATAMALPDSCNSNSCASLISPKHQGICPSGWHIPSDDDWAVLMTVVGRASTKLKARKGWDRPNNGTDEVGFSALPGGHGLSGGGFGGVGYSGDWWSDRESSGDDKGAYGRGIMYDLIEVMSFLYAKSDLYSVRCVKN